MVLTSSERVFSMESVKRAAARVGLAMLPLVNRPSNASSTDGKEYSVTLLVYESVGWIKFSTKTLSDPALLGLAEKTSYPTRQSPDIPAPWDDS